MVLIPLPHRVESNLANAQSWGIKLNRTNNPYPTQWNNRAGILEKVPHNTETSGILDEAWLSEVIGDRTDFQVSTLFSVFHIALEIAREGREGKKVGTAFIIGDAPMVLAHSKQIILNPFKGHLPEEHSISHPDMKETIKELAQLDGAFVITGNGIVEAAARRITVDTSKVTLPHGHGTRHSAIAAITQVSKAIGIVVSQSGGRISIIKDGTILKVIHPE